MAEVALAAVLTIGAGLLIKSFWRLSHVDAGFDARGVVKAEFQLPRAGIRLKGADDSTIAPLAALRG